ncbi:Enoyl-CoA hydratase [Desulfatibacillum alkenivorans DSM 16219]|jgi:2-(1,2-epoxy-1,2-dihydrophenyl)acetyl-CoA isomerase|uniref:Enoyl-CoA hydratase n=1 Tax=Desulfatibacillum alkenivorans DSM 16219 TaxID=1121393 RepID=A0A1M6SSF1_9BACT|nr:enoyl-CoA hydratase/isomerase family protein [Desulfatibacillum alkenivorans]SHK47605.1 Enoyl-CoA hydratase [Desulfatibacillum alkenivorans DSM 16219]
MSTYIKTEQNGSFAEVVLNRPKAFNSFHLEMITELTRELTRLAVDDSVRGVLITGEGKAFCAGGDLKWVTEFAAKPGASFHTLAAQFHNGIVEIRRMEKPVVAAVNGVAAGGGFSLALACDFRVMGKSAVLKQAYTSNGLCIDGGGTYTLPRLVGMARALEIAVFDEAITAEKALEWGLATKVVEDESVLQEARAMLEVLSKKSMHSIGWSKRLLMDSFNNTLEYQLELERQGLGACGDHPDGREGLSAFVEKRKPKFGK